MSFRRFVLEPASEIAAEHGASDLRTDDRRTSLPNQSHQKRHLVVDHTHSPDLAADLIEELADCPGIGTLLPHDRAGSNLCVQDFEGRFVAAPKLIVGDFTSRKANRTAAIKAVAQPDWLTPREIKIELRDLSMR